MTCTNPLECKGAMEALINGNNLRRIEELSEKLDMERRENGALRAEVHSIRALLVQTADAMESQRREIDRLRGMPHLNDVPLDVLISTRVGEG